MQAVEISDEDLLQERLNSQQGGLGGSSENPFDDAAALGGSAASATLALQGNEEPASADRLRITVDDPEVRDPSIFTPKYVAYAVTVAPRLRSVINVRRRYSDFEWLRNVLVKHYPGYFVPPLPPKKAIGNLNEDFLDERQGDLQRFMNRLCQDPVLPNNLAFRMFLCRHENSFEQGQKEAELALEQERAMAGTLGDRYTKLFPAALGKRLPDALPEEMLKLREVLERSEQELIAMLEMSRLSLIKQTEDAAAKRALATHLAALHKTENNYAERPEPARVDLCASFAAWAEQTASQQVPFATHLLNTIKFDLQDVQAFIEIVAMRTELLKDTDKAKSRADKWRTPEMESKALKDSQQKDKVEDMSNEQELIARLQVIDQIIRHFTLPATWAFKVVMYKRALCAFAEQQLQHAKQSVSLWQDTLGKLQ